ncbi:MAG: ABC-2 transporter permease [Caldicoprobacterales bacterium]
MLNLILKDILIQKKTLGFVGLYILILSIAFQSIGAGAFIGIIIAVTYQLVVTAGSHEDKAGADIIMNSLPLSRREIVISKYLSVIAYGLLAVLGYMAFSLVINLIPISVKISPITPENMALAFTGIMVMNSIYYPVYFKAGYVKSRIISFILYFVFFFGLMALFGVMNINGTGAMLNTVTGLLSGMNKVQFFLILTGGTLIFTLGSCILSIKFYNGREF